jgi:hypothetical protein
MPIIRDQHRKISTYNLTIKLQVDRFCCNESNGGYAVKSEVKRIPAALVEEVERMIAEYRLKQAQERLERAGKKSA